MLDPAYSSYCNEMELIPALEKQGYKYYTYPTKYIDRLSERYSIFRFFHKPNYSINRYTFCKGAIMVCFDCMGFYDIDIFIIEKRKNKYIKTFIKSNEPDEILEFLKQLQRELKLKRIVNEL